MSDIIYYGKCFFIREGVLYKYTGKETHIVIPNNVRRIEEKAFRFCNTIVSVEIPDSVTWIGWGAFSFCENLERLVIPPTVSFISVSAIEGCRKLNTITINNSEYYYVNDNKIYGKGKDATIISIDIIK